MVLNRDDIISALKSGDIKYGGVPDPEDKKAFGDWCKRFVQPASMDFAIGPHLWAIPGPILTQDSQVKFYNKHRVVDSGIPATEQFQYIDMTSHDGKVLVGAGHMVLAHSEFPLGVSEKIAVQVCTRSTAKRWGWDVCGSAGWVDPGYHSYVTLELVNHWPQLNYLYQGRCYGQFVFYEVAGNKSVYGGHYNVRPSNWTPECMLPKLL